MRPNKPVWARAMSQTDRHKTKKLANIVAIVFSAVIAALGIAGYQRTEDEWQLLLFLALSVLGFFIVIYLFKGINKLLDSLDNDSR